MVFPFIPIIVASVAGIGIEKGLSSVFAKDTVNSGTKKGGIANVFHEPYETYSPTTTYAQSYQYPDYNIIIDSPLARAGSTKKSDVSPEVSAGVTTGVNMTNIALIGAAGLILYGVVKK